MLSDLWPTGFEIGVQYGQVKPGDIVAVIGVHGKSVELHLESMWIQNVTISMGLVNANTTPMLLKLVASKKIKAEKLVTH